MPPPCRCTSAERLTLWTYGIALSLLCALFISCNQQPTEVEDYSREPVLTAFLTNGEPVDEVFLQWVSPLDVDYMPEDYGIIGADIIIFQSSGYDTLTLVDDPDYPGRYVPPPAIEWTPRGQIRYRIEARFLEDRFLWAETVVPDTFSVSVIPPSAIGDTLTRVDPNIVLEWTDADSAAGYVLNILSLRDDDSQSAAEEDSLVQSAVWLMRADQRMYTVPWILFRWTGPYRFDLLAVSNLYYDYVFAYLRILQGAQIAMPTNVHGGLGVFAGLARYSFEFYWERT